MNARVAKEEMALLMPTSLSHYTDASMMAPAETTPSLVSRIVSVFAWIADLPRRRAVLAELNELSDHELADIGLTRNELNRVFDPEFVAQRSRSRSMTGRVFAA